MQTYMWYTNNARITFFIVQTARTYNDTIVSEHHTNRFNNNHILISYIRIDV